MSHRLLEILAAAGLAPAQLQREQLAGQRDAANAQALGSAFGSGFSTLVGAGFKAADAAKASDTEDANLAAQKAIADQASSTGEYASQNVPNIGEAPAFATSPADIAKSNVAGNPALAAPAKTGDFLHDLTVDPFGWKADAAKKAAVAAQTGITSSITANRDKATATARQQGLDAQKATSDAAEVALRTQEAATQKANADTEAKKLQLEEDKADADANLRGFQEQDKRAEIAKMADKAHPSGGLSTKAKAAADKAAAAGAVQQQQIAKAKRLQEIYESGALTQLGGHVPDALKDPLRIEAEQLAHELALGVPSAFSGSNRLNQVEFKSALNDIIGSPDSTDTNEHKAQRARDLAEQLSAMVVSGAPSAAPAAGASAAPKKNLAAMSSADLAKLTDAELAALAGGG